MLPDDKHADVEPYERVVKRKSGEQTFLLDVKVSQYLSGKRIRALAPQSVIDFIKYVWKYHARRSVFECHVTIEWVNTTVGKVTRI